tara:strand:+ start:925 stop:1320 length:396 start_codon:yes stop_codon:yes gene_type:complete
MNAFENIDVDTQSFTYVDLLGQDKWIKFTPVFGSLTVVGATTYLGRYKIIGAEFRFQVKFSAATSIASTAGTSYLTLPKAAKGYSGLATMTNDTTNISVGLCHLDASTSRCYLPTHPASSNTFTISGWYEI